MFRRIVLALTFVAALGAAGVGVVNNAQAYGGCDYGGGYASYYGYRNVYFPSYYSAGYSYVPPVVYYPGRRHHHHGHRHGHHRHHRHHDHGHVSFSVGF